MAIRSSYKCSYGKVKPFLPHLKPGMLIVTRTEYLFGNLWIHGYWTHAGLVITGNKVIEAVGSGIRESSFEHS